MDSNKKPEHFNEKDTVFAIPRGIEVLVKKASVDTEFRKILLEKRGEAASEIDLELEQTEVNMLATIPQEQLEKIIENTIVPSEQKPVFMSKCGKLMLRVIIYGTVFVGLTSLLMPSLGHTLTPEQREHILQMQRERLAQIDDANDPNKTDIDSQLTGSEENRNE